MAHAPEQWEPPTAHRSRWPLLALLLVVGVAVLAVLGRDDAGVPVEHEPDEPTAPSPPPEAAAGEQADWVRHDDAAGTWTTLPQAPIGPRVDPVVVWTGTREGYSPRARGEVLVWGGRVGHDGLADGAAYDPFRGEWRTIAEAPHAWRRGSSLTATWTGTELYTFLSPRGPHPASAFAYDPAADRWRETAAPPANFAFWQAAGWTGEDVVLLAFARDLRTHRAAAYDPEADRWRRLPPARVLGDEGALLAVALPDGLAVFGEAQGHPATTLLPPGTDAWTAPDPLPGSGGDVARPLLGAVAADRAAERMLLAGVTARDNETRRAWAWSRSEGWERLPDLRTDTPSARTQLAWGGGRLLAWVGEGAAAGAVLEAGADAWRPMAPPPLSPRAGAGIAWTGRALVVWGGEHEGEARSDGAAFLPWSGLSEGRLRTGS